MREYRIFGPPGSGKTTTLSAWIQRGVEAFSGQVLVMSFTRAAAVELAGRGLPIDRRRIGTLHSMCFRTVGARRSQIAEASPLIKEWNARVSIPERVTPIKTADLGLMGEKGRGGRLTTVPLFDEYCLARNLLVPESDRVPWVQRFGELWEAWKREHDLLDFTDLIEIVDREEMPPPLPAVVLFIDEAQDLTPLELRVVRRWGASCDHFVLSGDDQQAIFSFRGATPDAFLDPPLPPAQKTVLGQSYRLPEEIRRYAHAYGCTMTRYEPKQYAARDQGGEVVKDKMIRYRNGPAIVRAIEAELAESRSVMVLGSCGYMLDPVIKVARARGIPFANPYRRTNGRWNPMRGGCERLAGFLRDDPTWGDVWRWVEAIDAAATGLGRGAKGELKEWCDEHRDDLASRLDVEAMLGIEVEWSSSWIVDRLLASRARTFRYAVAVERRGGLEALLAPPSLVVGSVHSVKGGEADTVILFPDISRKAHRECVAQGGTEGRDIIRRLFYVGMTRAREKLIITGASEPFYEDLPDPSVQEAIVA
jgi:DNA helicase-2/ATP-dependent DNA helicase PcrA